MQVSILGGTGDLGRGLALRWAYHTDHDVVLGSRDADRAREAATEYEQTLTAAGVSRDVKGVGNREATERGDVVVCSVPAYYLAETIETVSPGLNAGDVLVSPAVGMTGDGDGVHYNPPDAGSVLALAADVAPDRVPVVGAFHNLAAGRLADLLRDLDVHTPLVGDDSDAVSTVVGLAEDIDGLCAYSAGPLANAPEVEALTPLLMNLATYNDDLENTAVTFD